MNDNVAVHPVQHEKRSRRPVVPQMVTMQAYQVYCHIHGKQEAMIVGSCRGGFSTGELLAFLYAYPFPREEWRARVQEAFHGMDL